MGARTLFLRDESRRHCDISLMYSLQVRFTWRLCDVVSV